MKDVGYTACTVALIGWVMLIGCVTYTDTRGMKCEEWGDEVCVTVWQTVNKRVVPIEECTRKCAEKDSGK